MRYLLDTNVISEASKPRPSGKVLNFLLANEATCAVPSIVIAERYHGAYQASLSRRKSLVSEIQTFCEQFAGRILSFDDRVAEVWGEYVSRPALRARPRSYPDTQIAAIALTYNLVLVTRNWNDFPDVSILNPFD